MGFQQLFSTKGKATTLYKRGMKHAKDRKYHEAIADYNAVMEMPKAPAELIAMALFNRALSYSSIRDYDKAKEDLNKVLKLVNLPADVRDAAKQKLERMEKRLI